MAVSMGSNSQQIRSITVGNPYPSIRAEIVADYNLMGYHLVSVRFYPVEFEPKTKRMRPLQNFV